MWLLLFISLIHLMFSEKNFLSFYKTHLGSIVVDFIACRKIINLCFATEQCCVQVGKATQDCFLRALSLERKRMLNAGSGQGCCDGQMDSDSEPWGPALSMTPL